MPINNTQGTTAANFQVNGFSSAISSSSANYTLTATDYTVLASSASGTITLTLPPSMAVGKTYQIMRTDNTAFTNVLIVSSSGSKTINGSANVALSQYNSGIFKFDGTNWWRF